MSCSSTVARDFSKNFKSLISNEDGEKNGKLSSSSDSDHANHDQENSSLNWSQNPVQSFNLFQKTHLSKVHHLIHKSAKEETRKTRKASSGRRLVPPKYEAGGLRPPSFLEQQLLPGIKNDDTVPGSSSEKSKGTQLTIFYKGAINVYDDVSIEKARAVMLLAGESSFSAPVVKNVTELDAPKLSKQSNLPPSVYKIQTNLPIATRRSLRLFFDKRRDRILNRSPYVPSSHKRHEEDESSA